VDVRGSYDSAARAYAERLFDELAQKPLDRHLLNRFAEATRGRGMVVDLGCGPGHVAKYLHDRGVEMIGVDISAGMIERARDLCPDVRFEMGDMRALDFPDSGLAGVVAFYAIVHSDAEELDVVFKECRRILAKSGSMLLAFHVGDEVVHLDQLFETPVSLDFRFHQPASISAALQKAGFKVAEVTEREPYDAVEYPSRRCYLFCTVATLEE
jgi:SAM-dependent methyltransferase